MPGRRDALAGAAEAVLAIEEIGKRLGIVATVGRLQVSPDAVNVIPGQVAFTLDIRAEDDGLRAQGLAEVDAKLEEISVRRRLKLSSETFHDSPAVPCDSRLRGLIERAITDQQITPLALPSGAGHDAMAVAALCPTAMLFIRCERGISHNPAEAVTVDDVEVAVAVMLRAVELLAKDQAGARILYQAP